MRNCSPRKGYFFERRAPLGGRSTGRGVPGNPGGLSTPIFFLVSPKKKTAVEPSKEKTLFAAQLRARDAPCRAAGCGAKLSCSIDAASAGTRAGLSLDFRTQYAVLNKEVIGQNPNLTSDSFRAQSAAPGSRSGLPFRSVGADDLTDAPNFGTEFGRRRPCPRYGGPNPRPSEKGRIPTSARWASSE